MLKADESIFKKVKNSIFSYCKIKRLVDIFFALLIIIGLSPIMLFISIIIKLSSNGPILFKQERIGKNSKPFMIYKFRTMVVGTPNVRTDEMKDSKNYKTKIGIILRKLSLDELPQLLNILKGEMSFIGPRPMIEDHTYLIKERKLNGVDKLYPGISGLAQINGRDEISDEDKLYFDIRYLNEFSFLNDIKILIGTILKVVKKENAS